VSARILADVARVTATYFTDPFCPWSWAAEPALRRLEWEFGDEVRFTYVIGGMAAALQDRGAFAAEWLEAGAWSGMPVDPRALLTDPPAATHPAGLAVKAVAEQADPGPFLRRLREAIFTERRRVDRGDSLMDVARETSPALDLATLEVAFGSHGPVEALGADFERAAGRPRPSLEIGGTVLDARAPYADWRAAVLAAGASSDGRGPLAVEEALARFGPCATAEIASLCDLPGPRAPAELWRLALEWRVRPQAVLGGEMWTLA
jgi:putative protein-disulfide isomerase